MIGSLRGTVLEVHPSHLLLEVQRVGYEIRASLGTLSNVTAGEERFFYIHDHIREDAHELFGFLNFEERTFFEKLISVSGVGPKLALTILSGGALSVVRDAIMSGDIVRLTGVPGIGKKTAQKIILELKGQLVEEGEVPSGDRDVVEALTALGYSGIQAQQAVQHLNPEITDTSERIREALKHLAR